MIHESGDIMRIWIAGMVVALLLAGPASAVEPAFEGLDRNGNGTLEQAEVVEAAAEVLREYDRNGDARIDRQEFAAAGGVPSRFDLLDRDKNGLIDLEELKRHAAQRFNEFDTNRDGRIDTDEWKPKERPEPFALRIRFYF